MHIPDSVLSPATSAAAGAAMAPVWLAAGRRARTVLGTRQAPLLALGAAFCFTIMMFNIPAIGGTTAHPVAGTLLAVLLGPWAACVGISAALAIQALLFGDGGLLAFGANCFTMAFVLPFTGYTVYRIVCRLRPDSASLRPVAAAIGSYVGINAAAATVALILGIQPVLFHDAAGRALFFPFGLRITLPAMLAAHMLVAGPAEAIVTALVVRYIQRAGIALYNPGADSPQTGRNEPRRESLWIALFALVAISPLGLLAKGDAWGEWDKEGIVREIRKIEGRAYVPAGMARAEAHAYRGVQGLEDYASDHGPKGYIGAGLLGVSATMAILLLVGRLMAPRARSANHRPAPPGAYTAAEPPLTSLATDDELRRLPDWMRRSPSAAPPPSLAGPRPNRFVEQTVSDLAAGAAGALAGERLARQPGLLQSLDARAKVIGIAVLLIVVCSAHHASVLLCLYALSILMGLASGIPLKTLIPRVWLSIPLFVGAVTLPTALNLVTPGRSLVVLCAHPFIAVTAPGAAVFLTLMLRAADSVTLALLLTLTTRWSALLNGLRALFAPRLFLSVLMMTYRYIIVLLQAASEMFVARLSRTVGRLSNDEGRSFMGSTMGSLFGKTAALAEEVHAAMVSRGFRGDTQTLSMPRWRAADSIWILCAACAAALAWGGEHVLR